MPVWLPLSKTLMPQPNAARPKPFDPFSVQAITIRGARTHNLKSIDLDIPRQSLTVITGVSGSGKSSLAFDTIFAEGQRQYIDSLSAYARRFFNQLPRPDVDLISGLQPTLCIDQKQSSSNPRSTVGTVTEVYDYLRLLMARVGRVHCFRCGTVIEQRSVDSIVQSLACLPTGSRLQILAPIVRGRRGKHLDVLADIRKAGLIRARIDGGLYELEDAPDLAVRQNHTIEAIVDRIAIKPGCEARIADAVALAVRLAEGLVVASVLKIDQNVTAGGPSDWDEQLLSTKYACPSCDISYAEVEPRIFSFNSPYGACPECDGTGLATLVTESEPARRNNEPCETCKGRRLRPESLAVRLGDLSIADVCELDLLRLLDWIDGQVFTPEQTAITVPIVREIRTRIDFLNRVGVSYLTLARSADSLSGGELQRVRLATSIGSGLIGVCYVLDEPSIGLHPSDNEKLISAIRQLQHQSNTVIVVEHDEAMMRAADLLIDMGPGAGANGGEIVAIGSPSIVSKNKRSLTGDYLSGRKTIALPKVYRSIDPRQKLRVENATLHNLKNITVDFPLGVLICVTGKSGSGKSSLVGDILQKGVQQALLNRETEHNFHAKISGIENIDKIISIDQSPIGRSARSTPATYTGIWDEIRKVFAASRDAKTRGFTASRFSFNSGGGRCENCLGQGEQKLEMNFLADVFVTCPLCNGRRFNRSTLSVRYRMKNVADILEMSVSEARVFFENFPKLSRLLAPVEQVGLGYLKLGQPAMTLSGGESQRIKLASELARPSTGKTLYVLDEPTTGLHIADVGNVINVLQGLVDRGNSVVVIEHHLDVMKVADWIIDLGPGGGTEGGEVVVQGPPQEVAAHSTSSTASYLKPYF